MNNKITSLKEKLRVALTSTAKVISEDFTFKNDKLENFNTVEIDDIKNPNDFIRMRAETDSVALKKRFSDEITHRKNSPTNNTSKSLYNIAEKIRYESLGAQMLKGIEKNFNENYNLMINLKKRDQLKTKEDVPVAEAFELYMLKNFHHIKLNPLTSKMLSFWEKTFEKSIEKHKKFLQENMEDQKNYSSRFLKIFEEMDIFQTDENDLNDPENQDKGQEDPSRQSVTSQRLNRDVDQCRNHRHYDMNVKHGVGPINQIIRTKKGEESQRSAKTEAPVFRHLIQPHRLRNTVHIGWASNRKARDHKELQSNDLQPTRAITKPPKLNPKRCQITEEDIAYVGETKEAEVESRQIFTAKQKHDQMVEANHEADSEGE